MADNIFTKAWQLIFQDNKPKNKPSVQSFYGGTGNYNQFAISFNGEKNLGEIGPLRNYSLDYDALRIRSFQSYLESEISKTVLDKFTLWNVSKGLKLQSNPDKIALESEGISINPELFNAVTEARFAVWAKSKYSTFSGNDNLHEIAKEAFKNSKIGGDVLVILRLVNNIVNVQLIDGAHVQSPSYGTDFTPNRTDNGNVIRHGIEMSPTGKHVAYWVRMDTLKYERIEAVNPSTGLKQAFLVYGSKFRINNHRGMPLIAVCLETVKKLERYKEATVGSAEERQKIAYQIVHDQHSTGESPLVSAMAKAMDADGDSDHLPKDINATQLANTVAATTNKQTFNMPIGSELKALESKNELFFKEFYGTNADIICSAVGIPPNVAFSIYNDSFSASRAATKDWEHTITVNRDNFSMQFYQEIYNFWLHMEILKNKIQAPGYLISFYQDNWMAVEAYRNARFTGPMFPHIDPLKEVNAERAKLGELSKNIPLTTVEAATEALNSGDSNSNMEQFAEELKRSKVFDIQPVNA